MMVFSRIHYASSSPNSVPRHAIRNATPFFVSSPTAAVGCASRRGEQGSFDNPKSLDCRWSIAGLVEYL